MLNAVQNRMVEEALVEKEVYDAMITMRARIGEIVGTPSPTPEKPEYPELPDLPVGKPPPGYHGKGRVARPMDHGAPAGVPAEVMAVADPTRDPARPVAAFIPETQPSPTNNPFPQLGLLGRPLS